MSSMSDIFCRLASSITLNVAKESYSCSTIETPTVFCSIFSFINPTDLTCWIGRHYLEDWHSLKSRVIAKSEFSLSYMTLGRLPPTCLATHQSMIIQLPVTANIQKGSNQRHWKLVLKSEAGRMYF